MASYSEYETTIEPSWLSGQWGNAWVDSHALFRDLFVALLKEAVKARHPLLCNPDALKWIARDRDIDIGYRESQGQMSARLAAAWPTWSQAGRPISITDGLALAGYANTYTVEAHQDGSLRWWEFDVVVVYPFPWPDGWLDDGLWDDPGDWDDGGTWPTDVPPLELELVRSVIRKWKPTHSRCRRIAFVHAGDFWDDPIDLWSDGGEWHEDVSIYAP